MWERLKFRNKVNGCYQGRQFRYETSSSSSLEWFPFSPIACRVPYNYLQTRGVMHTLDRNLQLLFSQFPYLCENCLQSLAKAFICCKPSVSQCVIKSTFAHCNSTFALHTKYLSTRKSTLDPYCCQRHLSMSTFERLSSEKPLIVQRFDLTGNFSLLQYASRANRSVLESIIRDAN
jgi:hypothetical protein